MNIKRLAVLSLSAVICACSLIFAVGPIVGASANTLTPYDGPFEEYGYLDATGTAKYNPFGPYRFNYYSTTSGLVYGVDIPDSYGGPQTTWDTTSDYSVFEQLVYSNNTGLFGALIYDLNSNEDYPCINLQMNSDIFWLDSFKDWYIIAGCPCNIDLFVWYDDDTGYERPFVRYNQDYVEWEYSGDNYSLDIYNMLLGFVDEVEANYNFLNNEGACFVRTFTITFTPTENLDTFAIVPLYVDNVPIALREAFVFRNSQLRQTISVEAVPEDFFSWIFDAVGAFLETEFLPELSFGKLILIALGFVVFGLGIKIAFGG